MGVVFKVLKRYRRLLFNLSASENPLFLMYYRHLYKPRPGSLDEVLDNFSRNNSPVTFLQIGANDGFNGDPIHKFIKRDNWEGIMLEPQPDVYNNSLVKIHKKRPGIKTINAALDEKDGTRPLYKLAISNERWANGLSSFDKQQLLSKVNNKRFLKHVKREGITLPEKEEDLIVEYEIETISPKALLSKLGNQKINLLAIDTEGFDFEILKMLDLNIIDPELILYEEENFDGNTAKECREYLEKHGYITTTI
ncbi:MAG: FkbM family methyltransferase, partial [Bacteroidetes bacterium HGW-Bacteroidetes-15]